ncbi:hypothetical protein, partial [Planotetraspora phitsanulokensis]|uniref:hypothetical protein n=1 Tax=Planotetraspora phitsanulokensis TaxID=575192 RepID=UPI0031E94A03
MTARAKAWSSDGSSALKAPPCGEGDAVEDADCKHPGGEGAQPGSDGGGDVSSWGLVVAVEAAVSGLVVGGVPESAA